MTQQHPITPPPELIQQWDDEATEMFRPEYQLHLTTRAAQWGADAELEACCEWLDVPNNRSDRGDGWLMPGRLRAARRPKPPSLKEQALALIDRCIDIKGAFSCTTPECDYLDDNALITIRRALESIPNPS